MPLGLDPQAVGKFTAAGLECKARFLTIRANSAYQEKVSAATAGKSENDALEPLVELAKAEGLISIGGSTPNADWIRDNLTWNEAYEILCGWPRRVSELDLDTKKA